MAEAEEKAASTSACRRVLGKSRLNNGKLGSQDRVQAKLEEELERLLAKLELNCEFRVVWMPTVGGTLSGEVKNGSIYIYEADEEEALWALRHELIDHLITSRIVKPLVGLVNLLIRSREAEIYKEKERLVEILSKIV